MGITIHGPIHTMYIIHTHNTHIYIRTHMHAHNTQNLIHTQHMNTHNAVQQTLLVVLKATKKPLAVL